MDVIIPFNMIHDCCGVYGPQAVNLNSSNGSEPSYTEVNINLDLWNNLCRIEEWKRTYSIKIEIYGDYGYRIWFLPKED